MGNRILVLSASPMRDAPIDGLLSKHLTAMGHEVFVRPCLREGRKAVLEIQPNVVVLPPIRNPYSRDLSEVLRNFGCGVVTRHTEPSCDWQDFKRMSPEERMHIHAQFSYTVNCEIVWGPDEAEILNRRGAEFKAISVGSFAADVYKDPEFLSNGIPKEAFCQANKLDAAKPTILILSAWGWADSMPDLHIDESYKAVADADGRKMWLDMIQAVHKTFGDKYNVLVTLHPGVGPVPYHETLDPLGIPINTESKARELVKYSDLVIHAGSTTALGAHFMGKPTLQYGDQNGKGVSWWNNPTSAISRVAPYSPSLDQLMDAIANVKLGETNANPDAIKELETGRYGPMDGKATERAAAIIGGVTGQFKYFWPDLNRDYNQPFVRREITDFLGKMHCNICDRDYWVARKDFVQMIERLADVTTGKLTPKSLGCPWCASRLAGPAEESVA